MAQNKNNTPSKEFSDEREASWVIHRDRTAVDTLTDAQLRDPANWTALLADGGDAFYANRSGNVKMRVFSDTDLGATESVGVSVYFLSKPNNGKYATAELLYKATIATDKDQPANMHPLETSTAVSSTTFREASSASELHNNGQVKEYGPNTSGVTFLAGEAMSWLIDPIADGWIYVRINTMTAVTRVVVGLREGA